MVSKYRIILLPIAVLVAMLVGIKAFVFADNTNNLKMNTHGTHPRLIYESGMENRIDSIVKVNTDMALIHNQIISYCDDIMTQTVLKKRLQGIRLLDVSRDALKRIFYLAYAFRTTKKAEYADRAIEEILAVCDFDDWNPSHFLDVAEMAMGVSIGYDWLYDKILPSERERIVDAIKTKAIEPSFNKKYNSYKRRTNNWNSVCNAGMLYAAFAFYDELPDLAGQIIKDCITTSPKAIEKYGPDGGYPEGYCYWEYGTTFQILLLDALEYNLGSDFGLFTTGLKQSGRFIQFMSAPSGKCFNFSDSPEYTTLNLPLWWFAWKNEDNSLLYSDLPLKENKNLNNSLKSRFLPLIPIYGSRLESLDRVKPVDKIWCSGGDTPVFIYRGGWDNVTDTYLGVKGGSSLTAHAHMDAGSFIYEYNGVRWAMDLGMQEYYTLKSKGVKMWDNTQDGQRWDILRMRNDYHNTLTIDDGLHNVDSNAVIVDTFMHFNRKGALVDLTATLGKVKKAHREVSLDQHDYLMVIDSIECDNSGINLKWNMVTPANARIHDNNNIILEKDGRIMVLSLYSSIKAKVHILSNDPIHDYDEPNPGTVRVGFEADIPAHTKATFKVQLAPE